VRMSDRDVMIHEVMVRMRLMKMRVKHKSGMSVIIQFYLFQ